MTGASRAHRPADWTPLTDADPVPGSPDDIRDEANHMRDVARWLRDQAADLRDIGRGEELRGKYADGLRESATDLEKHLREVAERYEHVHGHLTSWADELEDLQDESVRLLRRAQAAEEHTAPARADHHDDPVRPYRVSLERLTEHRDYRAAHHARRINAACDDIIRDSRWERFSNSVADVLDDRWLSDVFNALGLIVSAVGIIALFCTPVGWIITSCLVAGIAVAAKDVLAAATGAGSWVDVALDTVGFLGGFALARALKSLKAIRMATKLASEAAAAEEAGARFLREARDVLGSTYQPTNSRTSSRAARAAARQTRRRLRRIENTARNDAKAAERARPMPEPSRLESALTAGNKEGAAYHKDVSDMQVRYPHHPAVQRASRHADTVINTIRGITGTTTAADWGSKAAGAFSTEYSHLEDKFTMALGSRW